MDLLQPITTTEEIYNDGDQYRNQYFDNMFDQRALQQYECHKRDNNIYTPESDKEYSCQDQYDAPISEQDQQLFSQYMSTGDHLGSVADKYNLVSSESKCRQELYATHLGTYPVSSFQISDAAPSTSKYLDPYSRRTEQHYQENCTGDNLHARAYDNSDYLTDNLTTIRTAYTGIPGRDINKDETMASRELDYCAPEDIIHQQEELRRWDIEPRPKNMCQHKKRCATPYRQNIS